MSQNAANLAVRFLIELAALVGLWRLGLGLGSDALGYVLAAGLVLAGAVMWGTFAVPGDRSRSGKAPVPVNGRIRLLVEIVVLGGGAAGWFVTGPQALAIAYTTVMIVHHALSWDRVGWLMRVDSLGRPPLA